MKIKEKTLEPHTCPRGFGGVVALFVNHNSIYKQLGIEAYDKFRDARRYAGSEKVICHPPCRGYSRYLSKYAKADRSEMDLALLAIELVMRNGGVLEHPGYSKLYSKFGLPLPGESKGGLKTIEVFQEWFGLEIRKRTWLLTNEEAIIPELPFRLIPRGNRTRIFNNMTSQQRARTTEEFAHWLIKLVKSI